MTSSTCSDRIININKQIGTFIHVHCFVNPALHLQSAGVTDFLGLRQDADKLDPRQEEYLKSSYDARGVRLDITVRDVSGRVFNVEMQLQDEQNIPKRMRYYSSTLDQTILKPGEDYSKLGDTVVMFITPFDPFGLGNYRYTFRNICIEDHELELCDGSSKIVLNATGNTGAISPELKGFLDLVIGINKNKAPEDDEEKQGTPSPAFAFLLHNVRCIVNTAIELERRSGTRSNFP